MYLQSSDQGYIKLEYRKKWNDGLGNRSQVRIINQKLGISNAPTNWDHLLRSLKVNNVSEDEFNRVIDRRIDMQILHDYRSLSDMKQIFGETYVDNIIESRGKRSFADDIKELYNTLIGKRKPKPGLTLIEGGADE
jgi:hypothetical protein